MLELSKLDHRIPMWASDNLVERSCPFCLSSTNEKKYLRPDGLTVVLCDNCDTHFISPGPTKDDLDSFYNSYYGKHASKEESTNLATNAQPDYDLNDVRICKLQSFLDIASLNVLDVGCGSGKFLLALKSFGACVTGIELNNQAAITAKKNGIENIYQIDFDKFQSNGKYDLITLNDVIEHPLGPMVMIQKALSLLNKNGHLLIWTPNNDYIFQDEKKVTLRVDLEHMQYLGSKACKYLSMKFPIEIIHFESLGFCTYSEKNNINEIKNLMIQIMKEIKIYKIVKKIYKILKPKNDRKGNYHLFVIFRKIG